MVSDNIVKKATRILEAGGVTRFDESLFRCRGSSDDHQVVVDGVSPVSCDCMWFSNRHELCSHMLATEMFLVSRKDVDRGFR